MIVFPAIDLKAGQVVRLAEGDMDRATVYGDNACPRLVVSDQLVGNSESVTRAVQSGERFKVWVDNFTLAAQPYTVQIDIR